MRNKIMFTMACLSACLVSAQTLVNGGFEEAADGKIKGWRAYGSYAYETETVHSGAGAIRCEVLDGDKEQAGVMQEIVYAKPDKSPVLFGGWSKAENVAAADYCIFLDIWYEGGGNAWGVTANWSQPTHDWEYTAEVFYPEKPIQKIQYFVFLRKGIGRVWFDGLSLERRPPTLGIKTTRSIFDFPYSKTGVQVTLEFWKEASWRCQLMDAAGQEREHFSGKGSRAVITSVSGADAALHVSAKAGSETFEQTIPIPAVQRKFNNPVKSGCAVWTADSMRRVTPLTYPSEVEIISPKIILELARNESESAQLLITASDDAPIADVTVELTTLSDSGRQRFDGEVTWQRVGYIRRQHPYHPHPCGAPIDENWLPDPLLPAAPFTVRASATQGVWLTARAGHGAKPGIYSGEVILSAGGKPLRKVPVTLRVRDFSNPKTFGLPTAFCVMDTYTRAQYPEQPEEMVRKAHDLMLDYRLNPDNISRTELPRIEDLLHARERGMNRFNILNLVPKPTKPVKLTYNAPISAYTPAFYEELKARLTPYVAKLREHGLEKSAYLYGFDERPHEYYSALGELWRKLKVDFPDIPVMTTSKMYLDMRDGKNHPEQDITDWFCPLTSVYDPALSEKLRAQGRQVWWYVCCGPTYPQANFASIEYPFIEGRLLGWLTYRYRADGLLFWHVNLWPDKPPLKLDDTFLTDWKAQNSLKVPGDGQLLYPGEYGPLPSIRLANVRDGVEDYEWLMMLAQTKGRDAADAMAAELIRGMTDFERSPEALRKMRARLADALETL
ncbi:MAG: glycoside hydrolase domain-containing protein [Kiritimatiellia bacterium]